MRKKHLILTFNHFALSIEPASGRQQEDGDGFLFPNPRDGKYREHLITHFFNKKHPAYRKLTRLYGAGSAAYRFADLCSPTDSRCGSFKDATRLPTKELQEDKKLFFRVSRLARFAAGKRFSGRFLTAFSAPIAKGRIRFFPAPSRSYRGLFVFPRKSCSSACPTYFRNRGFRRAAKYPMPAIFRRKASQNILTATLMPPIYGVRRGFLLLGIITAAEILPRTAKNIFRFRRSELLLSLILKLLRITCLQSPFPLPEVNIAKAKR